MTTSVHHRARSESQQIQITCTESLILTDQIWEYFESTGNYQIQVTRTNTIVDSAQNFAAHNLQRRSMVGQGRDQLVKVRSGKGTDRDELK